MSLEQIMNIQSSEPSQTNQVIQYFDVQSRIHLIKLRQNQSMNEQGLTSSSSIIADTGRIYIKESF